MKDENFTRDFKVLPSPDRIKELRLKVVEEEANRIKSELIEKVERGLGEAAYHFKTPEQVRALLIDNLTRWAKLSSYDIRFEDSHDGWMRVNIAVRSKKTQQKAHKGLLAKTTKAVAIIALPIILPTIIAIMRFDPGAIFFMSAIFGSFMSLCLATTFYDFY